jgi:hypothetical protein
MLDKQKLLDLMLTYDRRYGTRLSTMPFYKGLAEEIVVGIENMRIVDTNIAILSPQVGALMKEMDELDKKTDARIIESKRGRRRKNA